MKKGVIIAAVLSLAFLATASAIESDQTSKGPDHKFEMEKAEILNMLDVRMTNIQENKACIEAAKNHSDLRLCMEKRRVALRKKFQEMKKKKSLKQ